MTTPENPYEIIRYQEVDSTNAIALDLGGRGAPHGTVVQATVQSGGKGRQSRLFSSPLAGLYMSMVLRPELSGNDLPLVTLAAGVATAFAIEKFTELQIQLKWPNDLYVNGRKLGGILTEAAPYSQESNSIPYVVVGIGINVNTQSQSFPESLQEAITSLYCQTNQEYNIEQILLTLVDELLGEVNLLQVNKKNVLDHWQDRDYLLKKKLCWQDPQGNVINGVGMGLLNDGKYQLTTSEGEDFSVLAGDIILTEINGRQIK